MLITAWTVTTLLLGRDGGIMLLLCVLGLVALAAAVAAVVATVLAVVGLMRAVSGARAAAKSFGPNGTARRDVPVLQGSLQPQGLPMRRGFPAPMSPRLLTPMRGLRGPGSQKPQDNSRLLPDPPRVDIDTVLAAMELAFAGSEAASSTRSYAAAKSAIS